MVCCLVFQAAGVRAASPYGEFRGVLSQIKRAVEDDNTALALELLERASHLLTQLESRPLLDEEALRWDMAQLHLDRADSMKSDYQRAYFANESIKHWLAYIEWFDELDDASLEVLTQNKASHRIQRAVRQLGNAYVLRANIEDYSIRELFGTYSELEATHVSTGAMELWRRWLFRCPDWKDTHGQSISGLSKRFESPTDSCRGEWEDLHAFLGIWLEEQKLSRGARKKFQRWYDQLALALERKETADE